MRRAASAAFAGGGVVAAATPRSRASAGTAAPSTAAAVAAPPAPMTDLRLSLLICWTPPSHTFDPGHGRPCQGGACTSYAFPRRGGPITFRHLPTISARQSLYLGVI